MSDFSFLNPINYDDWLPGMPVIAIGDWDDGHGGFVPAGARGVIVGKVFAGIRIKFDGIERIWTGGRGDFELDRSQWFAKIKAKMEVGEDE